MKIGCIVGITCMFGGFALISGRDSQYVLGMFTLGFGIGYFLTCLIVSLKNYFSEGSMPVDDFDLDRMTQKLHNPWKFHNSWEHTEETHER